MGCSAAPVLHLAPNVGDDVTAARAHIATAIVMGNPSRMHRQIGSGAVLRGTADQRRRLKNWRTYSRIARHIEAGEEHLDLVWLSGAQRLLTRIERSERRRRVRR
jgi:hypothetical protein